MLGIHTLWRCHERGANLVELSMVLFILLMLVAGIIDFGRAFNSYIVINNASREGARYASRRPDLKGRILQAVKDEAVESSVDPAELDIEIDPDPDGTVAARGQPITVTVQYEVPTIIAQIANFGSVPLRARTTMVVFGPEPDP
jgi:Flp pilus assembly protein TadG